MTYEETIEYLYSQLPMYSRIGAAAYNKDLINISKLCIALNNPHQQLKCIHIAGTNGKGSCSHMLASILQEAGYNTGLYTSPHIKDFGERIRVNGQMISEAFVINFTERTRLITSDIKPSFFELVVSMAFEYFAQMKVDIAVIETGLGGRLDSTNIINPVLSIITNIGYDHMNLLGNSLPQIAIEKAGIIKEHTPVIIGEALQETKPVFLKKASEMNAPIEFTEDHLLFVHAATRNSMLDCTLENIETGEINLYSTDMQGQYQVKNLSTVVHAVHALKNMGFEISDKALCNGLAAVKINTGLTGRWDIIQKDPVVIFDVAHNEDGIKQLLQQLNNEYPHARFHFVLGFVNDKDLKNILSLFPVSAKYYFTNAHIPRALPYSLLQEAALVCNLIGDGYDDVKNAIENAKQNAMESDVIMVCGSFFTIAEAM